MAAYTYLANAPPYSYIPSDDLEDLMHKRQQGIRLVSRDTHA